MEKLKALFLKIKKWIWLAIAGVVIAFVAWKKHLQSETNSDLVAKEEEIKNKAAEKLVKETTKLEEEKKKELNKIEEEKKKKESELAAQELKEKIRLTKLAKENREEFKKEVAKKTGVAEKKKGRPKKK